MINLLKYIPMRTSQGKLISFRRLEQKYYLLQLERDCLSRSTERFFAKYQQLENKIEDQATYVQSEKMIQHIKESSQNSF